MVIDLFFYTLGGFDIIGCLCLLDIIVDGVVNPASCIASCHVMVFCTEEVIEDSRWTKEIRMDAYWDV